MTNKTRTATLIAAALLGSLGLAACSDDADVASENLSKAADNFEIQRQIVFFNGITDTYLLTIEGLCSIDDEGDQLEVGDTDAFQEYLAAREEAIGSIA